MYIYYYIRIVISFKGFKGGGTNRRISRTYLKTPAGSFFFAWLKDLISNTHLLLNGNKMFVLFIWQIEMPVFWPIYLKNSDAPRLL